MLIDGHQMIFEKCFENINEVQMVVQFSNDIGHWLYLQDPLNHVGGKQKASYIASMLCQILGFFTYLSYLASKVRVFTIVFCSYICDLDCYCY